MARPTTTGRWGAHPAVVWAIRHVVSPLDRFVVRVSRGRLAPPSRLAVPTLLLTSVGRRSGRTRTVPLIYVRDGGRFIVANARPAGEHTNPWVLNLRASGEGTIRVRGERLAVIAHELTGTELDHWWPQLVEVWPAFGEHFAATQERYVFALEPTG